MGDRMESLRQAWENLTERERRLVGLLGFAAGVLVVLLPFYLLQTAILALETENEEIAIVLRDIDRAEARIAAREAEAVAAEARYRTRAPELGSFLEARSAARELTIGSVTNQPEIQEGEFRRRHARAQFQQSGLWAAVRLMEDIEGSEFPMALERVYVDHFATGDRFSVELGVITYDRSAPAADAEGEGEGDDDEAAARRRRRRAGGSAGPPRPE